MFRQRVDKNSCLIRIKYMSSERLKSLIADLQRLRVQESHIIEEIERTERATREDNTNERATTADGTTIEIGSRVRIKNKVRRPASAGPAWTEAKERVAIVTRFYREQIHIRTENGTNTWRAKNNLELVLSPAIQR